MTDMEHGRRDNPSVGYADSSPKRGAKKKAYRRKRQGWDIHNGYLLYLIGTPDALIAELLGITPGAVTKRRRLKWELGHA